MTSFFVIYDRKPIEILLNGMPTVGHNRIDDLGIDTELLAQQQAGRRMILLGIETEQPLAGFRTDDIFILEEFHPLLGGDVHIGRPPAIRRLVLL